VDKLVYEPGRFLRRPFVRPKYVRIAKRETPSIVAKVPEMAGQRSSDTEVQGSQKGGVTGSGLGRTHTPYKAINLYRAGTSAQR